MDLGQTVAPCLVTVGPTLLPVLYFCCFHWHSLFCSPVRKAAKYREIKGKGDILSLPYPAPHNKHFGGLSVQPSHYDLRNLGCRMRAGPLFELYQIKIFKLRLHLNTIICDYAQQCNVSHNFYIAHNFAIQKATNIYWIQEFTVTTSGWRNALNVTYFLSFFFYTFKVTKFR